jgi:hypothetical protein
MGMYGNDIGSGRDVDLLVDRALGFDLQAELELCKELAAVGGPQRVKEVFDGRRAARLFQGLLSTGRHEQMDEHWKVSIQTGVDRGTLAPPEWN